MPAGNSQSSVVRFGVFELDPASGELRKSGALIKLQPQPFKVLALLAGRPGKVVTREELREQVWGADTFVDFEQGLNYCIKQIRSALGDDAETPRYIETLPRRGYRFLGQVEALSRTATAQGAAPEHAVLLPRLPRGLSLSVIVLLLVAALVGAGYFGRQRFWSPARTPERKIMLAVLPFENISGDPEQEYFSDGLTEEMIAQLGNWRPQELGVIARGSAMRYKHTDKGVRQIGQELGVDYILEGSVRRAGDRVRITGQLIQVSDQTHLWAESYERDLRDILRLQTDIARAVASEIATRLVPAERGRSTSARPVDPEAYEAYLRGRYAAHQFTIEGFKKAIEYYQQAIEKDPGYAVAYSGWADAYSQLAGRLLPPAEAMPKAKQAALKALELDPNLAEAHVSLGFVAFYYDLDWVGAEREYKRAIELNPGYPLAHSVYAYYLSARGSFDESLAEARRAQQSDPISVGQGCSNGRLLYYARRYDEAIGALHKMLEIEPSGGGECLFLGLAYAQKSLLAEAIAQHQNAVNLLPGGTLAIAMLGRDYALAGRKREALEQRNKLLALSKQRYVSPYDLAVLYAGLGDKEQVFAWLEKAVQDRAGLLVYLKVEPIFDGVRSDPRFRGLLRRIGIPT